MSLKLLPGRRECCASRVADKECAAQLVFERVNARADRRLADVKPLCGADEALVLTVRKVLASSVSMRPSYQ